MKVGICSLGCKVNTYESEYFIQELKRHGYTISSFDDVCDVYIINTCTVTNTSDVKSRKMIHRARRKNKDACVVAVGCFIEANPNYFDSAIDICIGNGRKSELVSILDEWMVKKSPIQKREEKSTFDNMFLTNFEGRCRAFVKIQDGCENFCSYCIIPYVRGKCRSKSLNKVVEEVTALTKKGYQEIVLTGIHTGNYGVDINTNFATLLKQLLTIKGLKRLRISSIEITELTDEVLDIIKENKVIVSHLHIPLQAGSDHVLKLMGRKYDLAYFEEKLKKIREIRPDIAITTDVIVGFPEETDLDFEETLKTVSRFAFAKIHVFPYSKREGTKASKMKDIDGNTKKERARRLLLKSKELEESYASCFLSKEVEVLIEEEKDGYSIGHTEEFMKVKIKGSYERNTFVRVKLLSFHGSYSIGSEVEVCIP